MFTPRKNIWQVLNMPQPYQQLHEQDGNHQALNEGSHIIQMPTPCYQTCATSDRHHIPIPILPTLLAVTLVQVGLLVAVFVVPVFWNTLPASTNAFSVLQYLYVVCWALITALTWHIVDEFHRIWLLGYHHFHRSTQHLHSASFFIYTGGLMMFTVLGAAVRDYCPNGALSPCGEHITLAPVTYQQMIVVLLSLLSLLITLKLANEVYRFNQNEVPADVLVDDLGIRLSQASSYCGTGDVGAMRTVLDAQSSMINYLKTRLDVLNRQGMLLANELEEHVVVA
ncbi:TMEM192 family [Trinorchestia longiramus]|nr:TMEM192 family [Trinorchestia longiramus]